MYRTNYRDSIVVKYQNLEDVIQDVIDYDLSNKFEIELGIARFIAVVELYFFPLIASVLDLKNYFFVSDFADFVEVTFTTHYNIGKMTIFFCIFLYNYNFNNA